MEAGIALLRGDVLELERGFWSPGCARGLGRGFWSLGCAKGTGEKPVEPGMCQGAWRVTSGARDVLQNETSKGVAAGVWEVLGRLER